MLKEDDPGRHLSSQLRAHLECVGPKSQTLPQVSRRIKEELFLTLKGGDVAK